MYQCILNVPLWNDWCKITYLQVHGFPVLKALSFKSLNCISATTFAKLIQFGQDPKLGGPELSEEKIECFIEEFKKDFIFQFHLYIFLYTTHPWLTQEINLKH